MKPLPAELLPATNHLPSKPLPDKGMAAPVSPNRDDGGGVIPAEQPLVGRIGRGWHGGAELILLQPVQAIKTGPA